MNMAQQLENGFESLLEEFPKLDLSNLKGTKPLSTVIRTDVLIVGSGPIGATYARKILDQTRYCKVTMIDVGAQESPIPGENKKNTIFFQKDLNAFVNVIKGGLDTLSVPLSRATFPNLNPVSWSGSSAFHGLNPEQDASLNLDGKATRAVGGMSTHWTCATPEPHNEIERPRTFTDEKWKALFNEARSLMKTSSTEFERSIRHQLVKHVLSDTYKDRTFISLPLACKRRQSNPDYVTWSSAATVLNNITTTPTQSGNPRFQLLPEICCVSLIPLLEDPKSIAGAYVKDLQANRMMFIPAKVIVVCAGAVLTPQILWNSGFSETHKALGRYLTEQTLTFCQVVLKRSLIDSVIKDPYCLGWTKIVEAHRKKYPSDPLPFPFNDPDPQVTTPVSTRYPWHTQIHRDAFSYGLVPESYDQRTIVDLRFFGYVKPNVNNLVKFSKTYTDVYGMPQPTFEFKLSNEDAERANNMMQDMTRIASCLGGYLPGAEPQFQVPGAALHICGTTRVGDSIETSVADKTSKVWNINNLYVGGCGVIPTGIACNPTLTAMCYAIEGANAIVAKLRAQNIC